MRNILFAVTVCALGACASQPSVSEHQCRAGDWQTIGFRDGSQGSDSTRLLAHQEACGEFGIFPGRDDYLAGWNDGVASYCTATTGFRLGKSGSSLNAVCRGDLHGPYAAAYDDGRRLFLAERRVNRLARKLDQHHARVDQIDREMIEVNAAQLDAGLDAEARVLLVADFKALLDERDRLEQALPGLVIDLEQAEYDLAMENETLMSRSSR